jgi:Ca-activated chloride channel homolog
LVAARAARHNRHVLAILGLLALLAGAGVATIHAQPTFRSAVDLVTVQVSVATRDGTRIGALAPPDFRVYEDGVLHDVALVSHEPRALSLCILLDSSPSMAGREVLATTAIDTLLEHMRDDDEVALLMFAWTPKVVVPWTRARDLRSHSWFGWRLALGTSLLDAMKEGLYQVERASNPLPVILIVSDGGENTSGTRLAELVTTRRQSETAVYGIRTERLPLKTAGNFSRAMTVDFLPDLVGDSGGTIYRARDIATAQAAAVAFLDELRAQYTIGYAPKKAADGKYRQLRVETTNTAYVVRHREGYLAQPR